MSSLLKKPKKYSNKIVVKQNEGGTITANGHDDTFEINYMERVCLDCELEEGYKFKEWNIYNSENCSYLCPKGNCFIMPHADVSVSAEIGPISDFIVQITQKAEVGVITVDGSETNFGANYNQKISLNFTPVHGFKFVRWNVYDDIGNNIDVFNNSFYVTEGQYIFIEAITKELPHVILAQTEGGILKVSEDGWNYSDAETKFYFSSIDSSVYYNYEITNGEVFALYDELTPVVVTKDGEETNDVIIQQNKITLRDDITSGEYKIKLNIKEKSHLIIQQVEGATLSIDGKTEGKIYFKRFINESFKYGIKYDEGYGLFVTINGGNIMFAQEVCAYDKNGNEVKIAFFGNNTFYLELGEVEFFGEEYKIVPQVCKLWVIHIEQNEHAHLTINGNTELFYYDPSSLKRICEFNITYDTHYMKGIDGYQMMAWGDDRDYSIKLKGFDKLPNSFAFTNEILSKYKDIFIAPIVLEEPCVMIGNNNNAILQINGVFVQNEKIYYKELSNSSYWSNFLFDYSVRILNDRVALKSTPLTNNKGVYMDITDNQFLLNFGIITYEKYNDILPITIYPNTIDVFNVKIKQDEHAIVTVNGVSEENTKIYAEDGNRFNYSMQIDDGYAVSPLFSGSDGRIFYDFNATCDDIAFGPKYLFLNCYYNNGGKYFNGLYTGTTQIAPIVKKMSRFNIVQQDGVKLLINGEEYNKQYIYPLQESIIVDNDISMFNNPCFYFDTLPEVEDCTFENIAFFYGEYTYILADTGETSGKKFFYTKQINKFKEDGRYTIKLMHITMPVIIEVEQAEGVSVKLNGDKEKLIFSGMNKTIKFKVTIKYEEGYGCEEGKLYGIIYKSSDLETEYQRLYDVLDEPLFEATVEWRTFEHIKYVIKPVVRSNIFNYTFYVSKIGMMAINDKAVENGETLTIKNRDDVNISLYLDSDKTNDYCIKGVRIVGKTDKKEYLNALHTDDNKTRFSTIFKIVENIPRDLVIYGEIVENNFMLKLKQPSNEYGIVKARINNAMLITDYINIRYHDLIKVLYESDNYLPKKWNILKDDGNLSGEIAIRYDNNGTLINNEINMPPYNITIEPSDFDKVYYVNVHHIENIYGSRLCSMQLFVDGLYDDKRIIRKAGSTIDLMCAAADQMNSEDFSLLRFKVTDGNGKDIQLTYTYEDGVQQDGLVGHFTMPSSNVDAYIVGNIYYKIKVNSAKGGYAKIYQTKAFAGEEITITTVPDKYCSIDKVEILKENSGEKTKPRANGVNVYTYVMTEEDITITPYFEGQEFTIRVIKSDGLTLVVNDKWISEGTTTVRYLDEVTVICKLASNSYTLENMEFKTEGGEDFKYYMYADPYKFTFEMPHENVVISSIVNVSYGLRILSVQGTMAGGMVKYFDAQENKGATVQYPDSENALNTINLSRENLDEAPVYEDEDGDDYITWKDHLSYFDKIMDGYRFFSGKTSINSNYAYTCSTNEPSIIMYIPNKYIKNNKYISFCAYNIGSGDKYAKLICEVDNVNIMDKNKTTGNILVDNAEEERHFRWEVFNYSGISDINSGCFIKLTYVPGAKSDKNDFIYLASLIAIEYDTIKYCVELDYTLTNSNTRQNGSDDDKFMHVCLSPRFVNMFMYDNGGNIVPLTNLSYYKANNYDDTISLNSLLTDQTTKSLIYGNSLVSNIEPIDTDEETHILGFNSDGNYGFTIVVANDFIDKETLLKNTFFNLCMVTVPIDANGMLTYESRDPLQNITIPFFKDTFDPGKFNLSECWVRNSDYENQFYENSITRYGFCSVSLYKLLEYGRDQEIVKVDTLPQTNEIAITVNLSILFDKEIEEYYNTGRDERYETAYISEDLFGACRRAESNGEYSKRPLQLTDFENINNNLDIDQDPHCLYASIGMFGNVYRFLFNPYFRCNNTSFYKKKFVIDVAELSESINDHEQTWANNTNIYKLEDGSYLSGKLLYAKMTNCENNIHFEVDEPNALHRRIFINDVEQYEYNTHSIDEDVYIKCISDDENFYVSSIILKDAMTNKEIAKWEYGKDPLQEEALIKYTTTSDVTNIKIYTELSYTKFNLIIDNTSTSDRGTLSLYYKDTNHSGSTEVSLNSQIYLDWTPKNSWYMTKAEIRSKSDNTLLGTFTYGRGEFLFLPEYKRSETMKMPAYDIVVKAVDFEQWFFVSVPNPSVVIDSKNNCSYNINVNFKLLNTRQHAYKEGEQISLTLKQKDYEQYSIGTKEWNVARDDNNNKVTVTTDPQNNGWVFSMPNSDVTISHEYILSILVKVNKDTPHGSITNRQFMAEVGKKQTITVAPSKYYVTEKVTVGNGIEVTDEGSNNFSFIMPQTFGLNISASFVGEPHYLTSFEGTHTGDTNVKINKIAIDNYINKTNVLRYGETYTITYDKHDIYSQTYRIINKIVNGKPDTNIAISATTNEYGDDIYKFIMQDADIAITMNFSKTDKLRILSLPGTVAGGNVLYGNGYVYDLIYGDIQNNEDDIIGSNEAYTIDGGFVDGNKDNNTLNVTEYPELAPIQGYDEEKIKFEESERRYVYPNNPRYHKYILEDYYNNDTSGHEDLLYFYDTDANRNGAFKSALSERAWQCCTFEPEIIFYIKNGSSKTLELNIFAYNINSEGDKYEITNGDGTATLIPYAKLINSMTAKIYTDDVSDYSRSTNIESSKSGFELYARVFNESIEDRDPNTAYNVESGIYCKLKYIPYLGGGYHKDGEYHIEHGNLASLIVINYGGVNYTIEYDYTMANAGNGNVNNYVESSSIRTSSYGALSPYLVPEVSIMSTVNDGSQKVITGTSLTYYYGRNYEEPVADGSGNLNTNSVYDFSKILMDTVTPSSIKGNAVCLNMEPFDIKYDDDEGKYVLFNANSSSVGSIGYDGNREDGFLDYITKDAGFRIHIRPRLDLRRCEESTINIYDNTFMTMCLLKVPLTGSIGGNSEVGDIIFNSAKPINDYVCKSFFTDNFKDYEAVKFTALEEFFNNDEEGLVDGMVTRAGFCTISMAKIEQINSNINNLWEDFKQAYKTSTPSPMTRFIQVSSPYQQDGDGYAGDGSFDIMVNISKLIAFDDLCEKNGLGHILSKEFYYAFENGNATLNTDMDTDIEYMSLSDGDVTYMMPDNTEMDTEDGLFYSFCLYVSLTIFGNVYRFLINPYNYNNRITPMDENEEDIQGLTKNNFAVELTELTTLLNHNLQVWGEDVYKLYPLKPSGDSKEVKWITGKYY